MTDLGSSLTGRKMISHEVVMDTPRHYQNIEIFNRPCINGVSFTTLNMKPNEAGLDDNGCRMKTSKQKISCHFCGQEWHYADKYAQHNINTTITLDTQGPSTRIRQPVN
jgi:hypothetical protein